MGQLSDHQLLAALYVRFRKSLYPDYMRGTKLLAAHGLGDNPAGYQSWIPNPSNPLDLAPDCCTSCGSVFGLAIGGRLRDRCYDCRSYRGCISTYEIQQLSMIWGCSQEYVVFLLAFAFDRKQTLEPHVTSQPETTVAQQPQHA